MTMRQAMQAKLRIEPGKRVKTFGGWCRRDRVLLDGFEIGKIQTRRANSRTEVLTITARGFVPGHNVEWLVLQAGGRDLRSAVRPERPRQPASSRFSFLRRNIG